MSEYEDYISDTSLDFEEDDLDFLDITSPVPNRSTSFRDTPDAPKKRGKKSIEYKLRSWLLVAIEMKRIFIDAISDAMHESDIHDPRYHYMVFGDDQTPSDMTIQQIFQSICNELNEDRPEQTFYANDMFNNVVLNSYPEYWYLEDFFFSTHDKDPLLKSKAQEIMHLMTRLTGKLQLEDEASNKEFPIILYRWLRYNEYDKYIYDDNTSYYSKFGFKRLQDGDLQKLRYAISEKFQTLLGTDPRLRILMYAHNEEQREDEEHNMTRAVETLSNLGYGDSDFLAEAFDKDDASIKIVLEPDDDEIGRICDDPFINDEPPVPVILNKFEDTFDFCRSIICDNLLLSETDELKFRKAIEEEFTGIPFRIYSKKYSHSSKT
jgi:hypothetical protein